MSSVRVERISITYGQGKHSVVAVQEFAMRVTSGQLAALIGPSGSGKSSVLHAIGGLITPTSGEIWVDETRVDTLDEAARSVLRRYEIAYVFQAFHLFSHLSALDNAAFIARLQGRQDAAESARAALVAVGLGHRLQHRPPSMSGGEQQRVGFARAIAAKPKVILADEPTGNLDAAASALIRDLLVEVAKSAGCAVIVASHDPKIADLADIVSELPTAAGYLQADDGRHESLSTTLETTSAVRG